MDKDDWSVPWPDGSWLTWNEKTESWDKQEAPPEAGAKTSPPESPARSKPASPPARKTPAKQAAATADKVEAPRPSQPPAATSTDTAWHPISSGETRPSARPVPTPPWREPVVQPREVMRTDRRAQWVPVAAGIAAGIATGYLIFFLIR